MRFGLVGMTISDYELGRRNPNEHVTRYVERTLRTVRDVTAKPHPNDSLLDALAAMLCKR